MAARRLLLAFLLAVVVGVGASTASYANGFQAVRLRVQKPSSTVLRSHYDAVPNLSLVSVHPPYQTVVVPGLSRSNSGVEWGNTPSVAPTLAAEDARVLFRVDTRAPKDIFANGFAPKGGNLNLLEPVTSNPADSGFVSTTKSLAAARDIQADTGAQYIYQLRGSGIDVNETLGSLSPYPHEQEIAIPGGVPACAIDGCWGAPGDGWLDDRRFCECAGP